ncbi:MAG: peroxiredoxin [Alcaligenaceae bacterium]|nr:peroxiredoxin [Alcaligenaceae bacterium]
MSTPDFPLPTDLPRPVDDGAADHLQGMVLPKLVLTGTNGRDTDLGALKGTWAIYVYPMTGRPGVPLPDGWDEIPGARGCTPQSCSFRDHRKDLDQLDCGIFGLSTQTSDYQREAHDRLHLPFELLSDTSLQMKQTLRLPTFTVEGMELYKRLTLIIRDGSIVKVFYPIFPSDRNVGDVLAWLHADAHARH